MNRASSTSNVRRHPGHSSQPAFSRPRRFEAARQRGMMPAVGRRGRDGKGTMSSMSIGKFQVVGQLGTGAHSTILHVRRSADGKNYALKVVPIDGPEDRKFQDQAEHELRVGQMLGHPNLIKVFACEPVKDWL